MTVLLFMTCRFEIMFYRRHVCSYVFSAGSGPSQYMACMYMQHVHACGFVNMYVPMFSLRAPAPQYMACMYMQHVHACGFVNMYAPILSLP